MKQATKLPEPNTTGTTSLEEALAKRHSRREFTSQDLDLQQISQLLWAAQGITHKAGFRTAPSAGALFALEVYLVTAQGVSRYLPEGHRLEAHQEGDLRKDVWQTALEQDSILQAPCTIVLAAVYERIAGKYGVVRTPRYVHMEVWHAAQNVLLQAESLGLGAVPIGAFMDDQLQSVLSLPEDHAPLYLIPVGHPK